MKKIKREYREVYGFNVIDEIKDENVVYCIDKWEEEVIRVNDIDVEAFVEILNKEEQEKGRFEFYRIIESEDEE